MNLENYIPLNQLCLSYKVEMSFFFLLNEYDLIEIISIEKSQFIHKDKARDIEKIIRMHQELEINFEGIETIFNLLEKINTLQEELVATKNKLKMYED